MAAFRRARAFQCGIELDVHLTKDGHLAVIHDKSLLRTAGADVIVEQLTVPQLKSYRLEGTQEKIPLLEEVLEIFQDGPPLLVELKADYFDVKKLVETAVRTLDQYRVNYCIESTPAYCCGLPVTALTSAGASCPKTSGAAEAS